MLLMFNYPLSAAEYGDDVNIYTDETGMTHFVGHKLPKEKAVEGTDGEKASPRITIREKVLKSEKAKEALNRGWQE